MGDGALFDLEDAADPIRFASRDTSPGRILEAVLWNLLQKSGYHVLRQVGIGVRIGGTKHIVDFVIKRADRKVLVSSKWQAVSGTGEDKVPLEVLSIMDAMRGDPEVSAAYVVLAGPGWTPRKKLAYIDGSYLKERVPGSERVTCVDLDNFFNLAFRTAL